MDIPQDSKLTTSVLNLRDISGGVWFATESSISLNVDFWRVVSRFARCFVDSGVSYFSISFLLLIRLFLPSASFLSAYFFSFFLAFGKIFSAMPSAVLSSFLQQFLAPLL